MEVPESAPTWVDVFTAAERPDLWTAVESEDQFGWVWPAYNGHGNHIGDCFAALYPVHADLQVLIVDVRTGAVVARGRTIPFRRDGSLEDLPRGFDAVGRRALEDTAAPTALSALAAEVLVEYQGHGLSRVVIEAMASVPRVCSLRPIVCDRAAQLEGSGPVDTDRSLHALVSRRWAPVRSLDACARSPRRFDRVRAGPRSMEISRPVSNWEQWTGMQFPEDGEYVFPGGLAPLSVKRGMGEYREPNVWMCQDV